MKFITTLLLLCFCQIIYGQGARTGIFDNHADIGNPKLKGAASYDEASQTYYLKGAGFNIWFNRDEFQYLYKKINGDFILTANFAFLGEKGNGHRKIGWMIRESLDEGAASYNAVTHGDGLCVLQWTFKRSLYEGSAGRNILCKKSSFSNNTNGTYWQKNHHEGC
jgi:TolB protein